MNAQRIVADGWEQEAARHRATARQLARENRELRARIADLEGALTLVAQDWALAVNVPGKAEPLAAVAQHAATLAEWFAHMPAGRIPARARLALAELQRLSAPRAAATDGAGSAPASPAPPRTPQDPDSSP